MEMTKGEEDITMRQLQNNKGMTLLEVAISLFILAIGLLGLAGLQLVALRSDTLGHQATLATTLAKAKLSELQKAEQLMDGADHYVDKKDGITYDRRWSVQYDVPQPEMATVRVQVSWRGELADRAVMVSAVALQSAGEPDFEAEGVTGQSATSGSGLAKGEGA